MPLLEACGLIKKYEGKAVVNDLTLEVSVGEVVGLLGPNGAGKTTAFSLLMGLMRPDAGTIVFQDQEITTFPLDARARLGIGYLAQEPSVFRYLTVEENILAILEILDLPKVEEQKRLEALLGELRLDPLRKKKAITLSGGERRRVEITRALVLEPKLLLLDEPFANIDPLAIQELKNLIRHLLRRGVSVLITDHNAREICSIAHRCYLMRDGSIFCSGKVEELVRSSEARDAYFGDQFEL